MNAQPYVKHPLAACFLLRPCPALLVPQRIYLGQQMFKSRGELVNPSGVV
ncbi:MAG TPA: hypothetical protein VNM72_15630 [Blastocatellia bacterium]|nr:hypothetical protein [Blastocatellia bacterium]